MSESHQSFGTPQTNHKQVLKARKWPEDRFFDYIKRCKKELCNGDIVLQQIFLRCFCLACVPNHYVLNMGLIYYTQLTLTDTDLSLHSKKTVTTKISWKPNTDHLYFLYGTVHQRRLTDKSKNEVLPTCNFPLHHHIKQTSLRSVKSISRNKTLEQQHLPKSNDATIYLTVVEVPSPDVTLSVKESTLCQSRNWLLPSWKYWSGFKILWWVQLHHL